MSRSIATSGLSKSADLPSFSRASVMDANADGIGDFQGTHAPFGLLARTGRIQCNGQSDSASPGRDEDSLLATKPENGHAGHASLRRLACEQLDFCGEQPSNGCD